MYKLCPMKNFQPCSLTYCMWAETKEELAWHNDVCFGEEGHLCTELCAREHVYNIMVRCAKGGDWVKVDEKIVEGTPFCGEFRNHKKEKNNV